jgi:hypothetical protein
MQERKPGPIRLLLALLITTATVVFAVPARGDPDIDDAPTADHSAFLASLRQAGITYNDANQAIAAGKAVCGLADNGESGLELLKDLKNTNPELTMDGAARFAAIAASSYCPPTPNTGFGGQQCLKSVLGDDLRRRARQVQRIRDRGRGWLTPETRAAAA